MQRVFTCGEHTLVSNEGGAVSDTDEEVSDERRDEDSEQQENGDDQGGTQAADRDAAKEEIRELEEGDPPENLEDWPEGPAKYETFGGPEGEHGYHEGPEEKLGPSSLRHHEDGSVEVAGDKVDDPDKYKGDPIPGGPTDPDAPRDLTTERIRGKEGQASSPDSDEGDEDDETDSDEEDE
jgi:hypothetical protein